MKTRLFTLFLAVVCTAAFAQRHKLAAINAETDQGKLLQVISQETDPAKRVAAMEEFVGKFPKDEAAGWVYTQLQTAYSKGGNSDKAVETGEKLLALDPMDIEAAYANLKASEAKKDSEGVLKWSEATSEIARKTVTEPKAADQSEEDYKHALDFAKQVDTYTEYSLYAAAVQETDPAKVMKLGDAIEKRNDKSQYIEMIMPRYSAVARQANAIPAAVAFGERAYQRGQYSEDMLLLMADQALQTGKEQAKVLQYSEKIIEVTGSKPKPEGVSDADWDKKKNVTLGLAYWMAGTTLSGQNKFAQADKMLRTGLPLVKDNEQLYGMALFHLGLSNYKMAQSSKNKAQIADAVSFSKQAAAIKGPLQAQAAKNVKVMQQEFGVR